MTRRGTGAGVGAVLGGCQGGLQSGEERGLAMGQKSERGVGAFGERPRDDKRWPSATMDLMMHA